MYNVYFYSYKYIHALFFTCTVYLPTYSYLYAYVLITIIIYTLIYTHTEEPFQRALKLEVFANTIRRDLSDLLHVSGVTKYPLNINAPALGYEVPFSCRVEAVNKLLDEKALTPAQVKVEIEKLRQKDFCLLHNNDPMQVPV